MTLSMSCDRFYFVYNIKYFTQFLYQPPLTLSLPTFIGYLLP